MHQIGHDQTARALMLDQDLSRYRLTRAISDEGLLRTCDMLTMPMRVFLPLAGGAPQPVPPTLAM